MIEFLSLYPNKVQETFEALKSKWPPHMIREVLDTLMLRHKISDNEWIEYCLIFNCS